MRIIEVDAGNWRSVLDFYNGLLAVLGAPQWHGRSIDALIDSMIWGGINAVEAPYTIRIVRSANLSKEIRDHIELVNRVLAEASAEFRERRGHDVIVQWEIDPQ